MKRQGLVQAFMVAAAAAALQPGTAAAARGIPQVWVCGFQGADGSLYPVEKVDFKNSLVCDADTAHLSDYCTDLDLNTPPLGGSYHVLPITGTWPETVTLNGIRYQTTIVGARDGDEYATIRFFSPMLTGNVTHADVQTDVFAGPYHPTRDPGAPLAYMDGYCQRTR